ncbi:RHS repeat-associated core domain-containing protein [Algibacter lectus]|uniref:RHS repeat-associated protein n=1 Tax=Algibacter lectus TaxID=221126 RepID=A0A4R8MEB7_9FLAO|nr:RHS repeat-associated core domain-containing protein [Algibacter lectus]TDY64209.1 RHS repeat-associated protein [Algibacter lectus]
MIIDVARVDIYGNIRNIGGSKTFIPFRYQGQYEDVETGLYYNRFRYYSPDSGTYISQDPIGLAGSNQNFYAYVPDSNSWIDPFGLDCSRTVNDTKIFGKGQKTGPGHALLSELLANKMAMSGKFKEIHLNRSYKSITGVATSPNRLPDVSGVDLNGKVHAIEIASDLDMRSASNYNKLTSRNQVAQSQLPKNMQGSITILDKPYDASTVKSVMDNLINGI